MDNNDIARPNAVKFTNGVKFDTIFAMRGDIFTTFGLFKNPENITKDDKILAKANRPVLIISDNKDNENIVRVLPLSSHQGVANTISGGRLVEIPALMRNNSVGVSYIDVKQAFTINTYQLVRKICSVSQEIVDTAVALNTLSNISNKEGAMVLCNYIKKRFPELEYFKTNNNVNTSNIIQDPSEDRFCIVEQIKETPSKEKHEYPPSSTLAQCEELYKDWLKLATDGFRYKYKLNKTQYQYLKNKCVKILKAGKNGFTKYDWKG